MSATRTLIFVLWIICQNAALIKCDVASISPELSQQSSELKEIKNDLKMLREKNEKILQDLNGNHPRTKIDLPRSCKQVQERGHNITDVYLIKPDLSAHVIPVVCDMERRGGGWAYLLNRFDGSEDYYLDWSDYKSGFGSILKEFWLGLDNIHYLTGSEVNELLVELVDFNDAEAYAHYDSFSVGSEKEGYSLKSLGGYSGTAGDSLAYHANMKFSTRDKDQDISDESCAKTFAGGWWYKDCKRCLLTGRYMIGEVPETENGRMHWDGFRGKYHLKQARMMVRPRRNKASILLPQDEDKVG